MSEDYRIRRALSKGDFTAIGELHKDSFDGGLEALPALSGAWWIVWYGETPIGFCGIHRSSCFKRTAYLCRVAVAQYHQGFGLQKRLIRVREKWARRNDIICVITDTDSENYASSNSLINCGYKMWEPRQSIKWADHDVPLYWKKYL